jgi:molybdopterin biosynthesis enzyme
MGTALPGPPVSTAELLERVTRGVLLKGEGAAAVTSEMVPVALFALLAAAVALAAYRRRLD